MNLHIKKYLFYWLLIGLMLLPVNPVYAKGSQLPPGLIVGDNEGITIDKNGDYFIMIENMRPGEQFEKEITVRNTEEKKPFFLYLQVEPISNEGKINLFEKVSVKIEYKNKVLYEGNLGGQGSYDMLQNPLEIGRFEYGDSDVITATFMLDSAVESDDLNVENSVEIKWNFSARKDEFAEEKKKEDGLKGLLPKTGEEWRNAIYRVCAGLFLLAIFLFLLKRKNKEEEQELNEEELKK